MSEDISELINDEINKAFSLYDSQADDSYEEKLLLINQISKEILARIENEALKVEKSFDGHIIVSGLFKSLLSGKLKELPPIWAGEIFKRIIKVLEAKRTEKDEYYLEDISYIQKSVNLAAVEYFRQKIIIEIEELDLPKKLSAVKRKSEKFLYHYEFESKALSELQEEIEKEISIKKEELIYQKEIGNLSEKREKVNSSDEISIHPDLTQRTATLFLSYLLDFAKEKSRENFVLKTKKTLTDADKDRIIDFLTPISGKQSKKLHKGFKEEIAKIAENEEVSEKFYQDMRTIRKYFEMLGLLEITDKIDADLGEK